MPFLEAIRQLRTDVGKENVLYLHLTLVPYLATSGELKTKPTQHSVKELRSIGIQPDVILCRSHTQLTHEVKAKIALFGNVDEDAVFTVVDVANIYEVPLRLYDEGVDQKIAILLNLPAKNADLRCWHQLNQKMTALRHQVRIAIVGKYVELHEAYKSLHQALIHGGMANEAALCLEYINSEELTAANVASQLQAIDGILVPGGFGHRGCDGKIEAVRYARENKVPFFGICLGMQCLVIEFARNVAQIAQADSEEFTPATPEPVIYLMREWYDFRNDCLQRRDADSDKGGSMRLGAYPCILKKRQQSLCRL